METARRLTAVGLGLIGLTALVSPEEFAHLFLGLSPDNHIHPYSWLLLEIAIGGLHGPALVLFNWPRVLRGLGRLTEWLGAVDPARFWWSVIALGLVLRIGVILLFDPHLVSDAAEYDQLGRTLAESGCYCQEGIATAYRAPGYPAFLALVYHVFGHSPMVVPWLQLGLGPVIAWLSFRIAKELKLSESAARLMAVILIVFPGLLFYTNHLLSELLFTALLLAGVLLSLNHRWWLLLIGGVVLGLAILTRPVGIVVPLALLPYAVMSSDSRGRAVARWAVLLTGIAVVCVPWMIRNAEQVGRFTVATSGGVNFYIGNHEGASFGYQAPDSALFALSDPTREAYHDSLGYALGWDHIKTEPLAFVTRAAAKTIYLFAYDADPLRYDLLEADYRSGLMLMSLAVVTQAWYLAFLMLVGYGLLAWIRKWQSKAYLLPLFVVVSLIAVPAVYFAAGRFHLPIIPFLSFFLIPLLPRASATS